ncbi:aspartyl protease family protein [Massilia solisilvae]|uniref:Aspartyl protease family protein n=1 Tax=Massilia solisilvae TaxID=1811225 RepID=A0ABT2BDE0_9BURK|nr:aspartyl protease family protein [Massilia solisilvae]MCS0606546.1 aspartyl protease family protein [Massilia solisilvae]
MTTSPFSRGLALLGVLLCASPADADDNPPKCQYVMVAELPLNYTGLGLQVTTEGSINDTKAVMLVDTGAYRSMLTRTATDRLDLSLGPTGEYAIGIGGFSRVYAARVNEFKVGPSRSGKGRMPVIGDMGSAPAEDAIVGAPFLLQTDLEFALAEKKLRFFRPSNCKNTFLGYWGDNVFEIPFESHYGSSPNPHFYVEVNGQQMEAMIDSGAVTSSMFSAAAKRAGLKIDKQESGRLGSVVGIGTDRVARWRTTIDSLRIGAEKVSNAEMAVLEADGPPEVDIILGDDFLRAHRVLFAMSQKKLYISYLGGEPFKQTRAVEPWLVQEAEGGNADAQLVLSSIYRSGSGVPKDAKEADAWLDKAVALGHPQAYLQAGYRLLAARRFGEAASRLRSALDAMPAERTGALWLYLARLQSGQPDLAKRELEAAFARGDRDDWPVPVADFYLGRIDAAALLDAAGKERRSSKARTCSATSFMAELYSAQGDNAQAESMRQSLRAHCAAPAKT